MSDVQRIQRGVEEYVRVEFRNKNKVLTDPDSGTGKVSFKWASSGDYVVDFTDTTLNNVALTQEGSETGKYYFPLKLKADAELGKIYCYPRAELSSEEVWLDHPIVLESIDKEQVPDGAYCSIPDVESELPGRAFTSETVPTLSQVWEDMLDVSEEMDSRLPQYGYDLPVAGTDALRILKKICVLEVASRVEYKDDSGNHERAKEKHVQYEKKMALIKCGDMKLPVTSDTTGNLAVTDQVSMIGGLGTDAAIGDEDKDNVNRYALGEKW
jgi:hypothetical protein